MRLPRMYIIFGQLCEDIARDGRFCALPPELSMSFMSSKGCHRDLAALGVFAGAVYITVNPGTFRVSPGYSPCE